MIHTWGRHGKRVHYFKKVSQQQTLSCLLHLNIVAKQVIPPMAPAVPHGNVAVMTLKIQF